MHKVEQQMVVILFVYIHGDTSQGSYSFLLCEMTEDFCSFKIRDYGTLNLFSSETSLWNN